VVLFGELWSEAVEAMRRISGPSQEDKRPAGATPIQNFKLDTRFDRDHLDFMRR